MSRILVAGAGHGGVTAAIKLAEAGYDVTIVEKNSRENCGLEQFDSFDATAMEYAGFEIPERYKAKGNQLTFVPLDDDVTPITLPVSEGYNNLKVDRKDFINYLFDLADKAGAKFLFETEITGPIMLGNRVAGIKTSSGDMYADLIIDACGIYSPVRRNLLDFLCIDKNPEMFDVLHTYRAEIERIPDVPEPKTEYNLYFKYDGPIGFNWLITEKQVVDVLLVRFHEISYSDVADGLHLLYTYNPHMGKKVIRGGKFVDIPVRPPLAVMVADGYAAVGDAAFMTFSAKGSGIAYSLKAGTMLAESVIADSKGFFTGETLWEYQRRFFKEIGFDACRIAAFKNMLPYVKAEEVNGLIKDKLFTTEELSGILTYGLMKGVSKNTISYIREKIKLLDDYPEFKAKLLNVVTWAGKASVMEAFYPAKYDYDTIVKWSQRYNRVFDSMRYKEGTEPEN